jgi:hypothetical protein
VKITGSTALESFPAIVSRTTAPPVSHFTIAKPYMMISTEPIGLIYRLPVAHPELLK